MIAQLGATLRHSTQPAGRPAKLHTWKASKVLHAKRAARPNLL